jgi:DNA repair exonuclease SbcCD ATPase subunit
MSRVHLRKVTVEGFRAFVERQSTPELPSRGLIGIRGRNLDTSGSSGAGKSSIAYAICYALGLLKAPFSAAKLKSKWSKAPMQVELELEADGVPVVLKRGKITSIQVGSEPEVSGSVEAVEERLHRLLGLDSDLLRALTFRQQKKPGLFLAMKDAAKKEFLSALLGLQEVEKQIEEAVPRSNQLKVEAEKLETAKKALEGQLREPAEVVLVDMTPFLVAVRDLMERNRIACDALRVAEAALEQEKVALAARKGPAATTEAIQGLQQALQECDRRIAAARKDQEIALEVARQSASQAHERLETLKVAIGREPSLSAELKKVQTGIHKAESAVCPTCDQQWSNAADRVVEWKMQEKELQGALEAITYYKNTDLPARRAEAQAALEVLQQRMSGPEVTKLQEVRSEIERRLAHERAEHSALLKNWQATEKAALADFAAEVATRLRETQLIATEVYRHNAEVERGKTHNEQALAVRKREEENYQRLKADIAKLEAQIQTHTRGFAREADLATALRAFLGSIFDEVLAEISAEANELLLGLKNVATTTLTFVSDKTTEKGAVKQQIRPVVVKNGVELDWEVDLSGGQGTSLELAVDLAVARVIGRRTGRRPGWLILDEAFEGHDMQVKESCLEVLQKAAQDCAILIVDHASELREYFASFIDVESSNEVARIVA